MPLRRLAAFVALLCILAMKGPGVEARVRPARSLAPLGQDGGPGTPYLISDEQFVSGSLRGQFAVARFLQAAGGALESMELEPVLGRPMPAAMGLAFLSEAYSVSPSLLLTLAEMEHGALSGGVVQDEEAFRSWLRWTALSLSRWFYDAYYGRALPLTSPVREVRLEAQAGNAATYALRAYYLSRLYGGGEPGQALGAWEAELRKTYERYFGPADAGKLQMRRPDATAWTLLPSLLLPWRGGENWYFTGGPHNMDGSDRYPRSGVDFQPVGHPGCEPPFVAHRWVAASAAGRAIDYQSHWVKLDHDHDGDAATGWQTVYGHLANRVADGVQVRPGEWLGNPSCYGGFAGGVHVHFGVKYENVWQPVEAVVLSGWHFQNRLEGYEGAMVREGEEERISCVQPDRPNIDCAHATLKSDNWGEKQKQFR